MKTRGGGEKKIDSSNDSVSIQIFFFPLHPFSVEMQAASVIALFVESHNCDKEKLSK